MRIPFLAALFPLATLCIAPRVVLAAESYDNCIGFIDSLPATITGQGVWCLRHDLATDIGSGAAITIGTNNVTLDCNSFKLDGRAGGQATSIHAEGQKNITIRHCNVRGFMGGIVLETRIVYDDPGSHLAGGGHVVEDNRLDNNDYTGIYVDGDHNLVRRNRVFETGGASYAPNFVNFQGVPGIIANADIVDNIVDGVTRGGTYSAFPAAYGIVRFGRAHFGMGIDARIEGNRVGGLKSNADGAAYGIFTYDVDSGNTVHDAIVGNRVTVADTATGGGGISIDANNTAQCAGNTVAGFATPYQNCTFVAGTSNLSH